MTYQFRNLLTDAIAEFAALDKSIPQDRHGGTHLDWPIDKWNPEGAEARWLELYNLINGAGSI